MRIPLRTAAMAVVAASVLAQAPAAPAAPVCADHVISGAPVLPNAVGCWNAIAVTTVRAALPHQVESVIYMSYTQTAVYDALTKIDGRYRPYHDFPVPSDVDIAGAS